MRRAAGSSIIIGVILVLVLSLIGCSGGTKELGKVEKISANSGNIYDFSTSEKGKELTAAMNVFGAKMTAGAYGASDDKGNIAISPVSLYMALGMLEECCSGKEREDLLSVLGVSYDTLSSELANLYEALNMVREDDLGKKKMCLTLDNSIWLDEGVAFKQDCIDNLAQRYYCHSFSTKFKDDNKGANRAIRKAVKKNTHGLINRDFELSPDTLFTIINTLYLKDVWNDHGDDMDMTDKEYAFKNRDGSTTNTKLLDGRYIPGKIASFDSFDTFYTDTNSGVRIKFLLPREGYSIDDIMTSDNFAKANSISDYKSVDEEAKKQYYTACLFPEYKARYSDEVSDIIYSEYGIHMPSVVRNLTDADMTGGGTSIIHETSLTVNRKGIEGAAATVLPGCTSPGPGEYEKVYNDFVIDRAFGFIITMNDIELFSGAVTNIA